MSEIQQVYQTPDGQSFNSKAEAQDHMRRPKIKEALDKLTDNNGDLTTWLLDNKDVIDNAFEVGLIRRVTKSDKKKLLTALEEAKKLYDEGNTHLRFLAEHLEDIHEGFRYPTQKRMSDEERAVAAKNTLMSETDNNEGLADWVIANKDAIMECFEAGKEKRKVSPKATKGLLEYRVQRATEKVATLKTKLAEAKKAGDEDAVSEVEEDLVEAKTQLDNAEANLKAAV